MIVAPWLSAAFVRPPYALPHVGVRASAVVRMSSSVSGMIYSAPEGNPKVQLFTKAGCTLCDKAKEVLAQAAEQHPHSLEAVDITDAENAQWWAKYKYDIPVLHIDGIYWAKHR